MVMRLICTQNNRVRFLEEAQLYFGNKSHILPKV